MLPTSVRLAAAITCVHPALMFVVQQHVYGTCGITRYHISYSTLPQHPHWSSDQVSGCCASPNSNHPNSNFPD
ncbi:hypothetical protein BDFB_000006 [Asbolus verrucosus]|uniref:Secreted protein n=1 Tax=Asbolus verrucosus TaxID=1661398 RepID=A0A482VT08_ASBVE|nr:hypothetical protein BDFB_000006 [Asbolus verrucosus]